MALNMLKANYYKHRLKFRFEAGTSRGILKEKDTWFILLSRNGKTGIGECAPIAGLSPDTGEQVEAVLIQLCNHLSKLNNPPELRSLVEEFHLESVPSVRFGLETALLDLCLGGKRKICRNEFFDQEKPIPINGLIWMGDEKFMQEQVEDKLRDGYSCIKMKIGAIDFDTELKILNSIRRRYDAKTISLRVDANGAFTPAEALEKLKRLSEFELHSIEQPIRSRQLKAMAELCQASPVPIALDEELIGLHTIKEKEQLLEMLRPPYLVLKPTLLGGQEVCMEWIRLAEEHNIDWWLTSSLEANIGLNAISQLASQLEVTIPQGLGTGQLYENNIPSPLTIENGCIQYDKQKSWDLSILGPVLSEVTVNT
jgi:o-succinylbenzoate synthase